MTVRVYTSNDASAPVLTGQVGSLTTLLDAVLVNGYGSKTAAGWSINQTTTNKRGYKQNLTGSNNSSGMLLYVDDTGPGAGGAREARCCGFETMSAITPTGTGQFPTAAQSTVGTGQLVIRKSNTADATARAWTIIANGQTIYMIIENGDQTAPNLGPSIFVFGDYKSYKSGDQYAVGIVARCRENVSNFIDDFFQMFSGQGTTRSLNSRFPGHYTARSWTGLGGSIGFQKLMDNGRIIDQWAGSYNSDVSTQITGTQQLTSGRNITTSQWPSPNGPDGALWTSPVYVCHSFAMRGYWPGVWALLHDRPLAHNDVITVASGNLNGKTLLCQQFMASIAGAADTGQILFETSDTWS
jgi:hypothetical protein